MTVFLIVIAVLVGLAVALLGLAHYWANTHHGRIKPTFALVFGLAKLLNPKGTKRGLGAAEMDTPELTEKMRAEFLKNMAPLAKPVAFAGTIEDRLLPGAPGGELPVRIYRPDAADGGGTLPLIMYLPGGGFVVEPGLCGRRDAHPSNERARGGRKRRLPFSARASVASRGERL
jgi:acetyl esterase/lipase